MQDELGAFCSFVVTESTRMLKKAKYKQKKDNNTKKIYDEGMSKECRSQPRELPMLTLEPFKKTERQTQVQTDSQKDRLDYTPTYNIKINESIII